MKVYKGRMKLFIISIIAVRFFWNVVVIIGALIGCKFIGDWINANYPITYIFVCLSWLFGITCSFAAPKSKKLIEMLKEE